MKLELDDDDDDDGGTDDKTPGQCLRYQNHSPRLHDWPNQPQSRPKSMPGARDKTLGLRLRY